MGSSETQSTEIKKPNGAAARNATIGVTAGGIGILIGTLLQGQPELAREIIGWGPGIVVLGGFFWLAHSYMPPAIESQREIARSMGKMADTVEKNLSSQHDIVLAMQVNSDKLEQMRVSVIRLESAVYEIKREKA